MTKEEDKCYEEYLHENDYWNYEDEKRDIELQADCYIRCIRGLTQKEFDKLREKHKDWGKTFDTLK